MTSSRRSKCMHEPVLEIQHPFVWPVEGKILYKDINPTGERWYCKKCRNWLRPLWQVSREK